MKIGQVYERVFGRFSFKTRYSMDDFVRDNHPDYHQKTEEERVEIVREIEADPANFVGDWGWA